MITRNPPLGIVWWIPVAIAGGAALYKGAEETYEYVEPSISPPKLPAPPPLEPAAPATRPQLEKPGYWTPELMYQRTLEQEKAKRAGIEFASQLPRPGVTANGNGQEWGTIALVAGLAVGGLLLLRR